MSGITGTAAGPFLHQISGFEKTLLGIPDSQDSSDLKSLRESLAQLESTKAQLEDSIKKVSSALECANKDPVTDVYLKVLQAAAVLQKAIKATQEQHLTLNKELNDLNKTIEKTKRLIARLEMRANQS